MTKSGIAITVRTSGDLQQFARQFAAVANIVRAADGSYVLYVDRSRAPGTQTAFITKQQFDRAVSPAMHIAPRLFSDRVAGGRFLPHRLEAAYSAVAREQMALQAKAQRQVITNRRDYIAVYSDAFSFYPDNPIGRQLNSSTSSLLE